MNPLAAETSSFLGKPTLDRIGPTRPDGSGLRDYLDHRTRPWRQVSVQLPGEATAALWSVLVANGGLGTWLVLVLYGTAPCSGPACTIATWGHPTLILVLAASCVTLLTCASFVTRGLSEAGAVPLGAVLLGAASGVVAISGLVTLVLIGMVLAATVFVLVAVGARL